MARSKLPVELDARERVELDNLRSILRAERPPPVNELPTLLEKLIATPDDRKAALFVDVMRRMDEADGAPKDHNLRFMWTYDPQFREILAYMHLIRELLPSAGCQSLELLNHACRDGLLPRKAHRLMNRYQGGYLTQIESRLLDALERWSGRHDLGKPMEKWLTERYFDWLSTGGSSLDDCRRAGRLLGAEYEIPLHPGEAWSDRALADIDACPPKVRSAWIELLYDTHACSGTSPTKAWLKQSGTRLAEIGGERLSEMVCDWFRLVEQPRTQPRPGRAEHLNEDGRLLMPEHQTVLRGLCWLVAAVPSPEVVRALGRLALTCYEKVPGIGPRAVKLGHAAIHGLGQIPGDEALGQLAMLKIKVKFIPAQKMIAKALAVSAERQGVPTSELEELGVPRYGMGEVGVAEERFGEHTARFTLLGVGRSEMVFFKHESAEGAKTKNVGAGGAQKVSTSVPAGVKREFAGELKEFKARAKDAAAMLSAQRDRLDGLFLQDKSWAYPVWGERYLHHPIVGVLARRLIWNVGDAGAGTSVTWMDGVGLVDAEGKAVREPGAGATVRLWHPALAGRDEVQAWRRFFEEREVRQPFKQAHREIYLLTDAERNTRTYSNRFAAHVLKQHQFHALAGLRGWRNRLRLMVDDEYPPTSRELEPWGLRAEFWVEGAGEETTGTGSYLYLSTDQVRFYRIAARENRAHAGGGGYAMSRGRGAVDRRDSAEEEREDEPVALTEIPPLVLSEILRDVDLFVGVASVANNPEWQDGGPDNRYREYWWTHTFGEIGVGGAERKELLTRLLPRLKIADRCSIEGKFVWVRGTKRVYKIHMGSGNILMEPNDEYLCIVPDSRQLAVGTDATHLPFEGDRVLSVILSKAFLLAADDKIRDESIVRQIERA